MKDILVLQSSVNQWFTLVRVDVNMMTAQDKLSDFERGR